jgi:hypothetical protein
MFDRFQSTLDRELGPAPSAHGGPPVRDPWIRDWPLLLGLALSAALVAASMLIGGSAARPAAAASKTVAAPGTGATGQVIDVGEAPALDMAKPGKKPASTPKKAAKPSSKKPAGSASHVPASSAPKASAGANSGSGSGSSSGSTRKGTGHATPSTPASPPKSGRIVNVTGTSAAFTNGPLSYAFTAPSHAPMVGKHWRLSLTVKRLGAPATGTVKVDILHQGSVVGHAASGSLRGGRFAHDFAWPDRSVGVPLTVKATFTGGGFTQSFLFDVKVAKAG